MIAGLVKKIFGNLQKEKLGTEKPSLMKIIINDKLEEFRMVNVRENNGKTYFKPAGKNLPYVPVEELVEGYCSRWNIPPEKIKIQIY